MKSYITKVELSQQQQQNSPYLDVANQVLIGILVDLIPIIASTIFAWLFFKFKNQLFAIISKLETITHFHLPEIDSEEEAIIQNYFKQLSQNGFNRITFFVLDNFYKKNKTIYAKTFYSFINYSTEKAILEENKYNYCFVSLEINNLIKQDRVLAIYNNYTKGFINTAWLKHRKIKSYAIYLINKKYTGFILLEKTQCHFSCPVNTQKIQEILQKIDEIINA